MMVTLAAATPSHSQAQMSLKNIRSAIRGDPVTGSLATWCGRDACGRKEYTLIPATRACTHSDAPPPIDRAGSIVQTYPCAMFRNRP